MLRSNLLVISIIIWEREREREREKCYEHIIQQLGEHILNLWYEKLSLTIKYNFYWKQITSMIYFNNVHFINKKSRKL